MQRVNPDWTVHRKNKLLSSLGNVIQRGHRHIVLGLKYSFLSEKFKSEKEWVIPCNSYNLTI